MVLSLNPHLFCINRRKDAAPTRVLIVLRKKAGAARKRFHRRTSKERAVVEIAAGEKRRGEIVLPFAVKIGF
jgi:hypothetical protein